MLDKKHKLPRNVRFNNRGAIFFPAFVIKTKDNNFSFPRFGIVVSKKIEKNAVGRNRLKRQIKNSIKKILPNIKKGKDVLIIAKKEIREKMPSEILSTIKDSFKKANLIP